MESEIIPVTTTKENENNPGTYEDLHRKCRDIFPICFEGAKVMVMKALSSHFQVSHTLSISQAITGYKFSTTYVGTNQVGPNDAYPVFLGDTDINGNTSATILHQLRRYRMKFQGQIQSGQLAASQLSIEYRAPYSTSGFTIANPNIIRSSGIFVGHYLRRITDRLDLGAECVHQLDPKIPGKQICAMSYGVRYTKPNFEAAATLSSNSIHATYYHKQVDNMQIGVEFESNFRLLEATTTLAYQLEIPESLTFRASCDTNWTVGAVLEKRLSKQVPFTLAISGTLNHVKGLGKFGIGLLVG